MDQQITTALLIVAGAGIATLAFFSYVHNSFRSALMPDKAAYDGSKDDGRYVGRIY